MMEIIFTHNKYVLLGNCLSLEITLQYHHHMEAYKEIPKTGPHPNGMSMKITEKQIIFSNDLFNSSST